jgi:hypothetical protein
VLHKTHPQKTGISIALKPADRLAGAEAIPHRDKLSTGALLARFLGLAYFDDRSVEPEFPTSTLPPLMSRRCLGLSGRSRSGSASGVPRVEDGKSAVRPLAGGAWRRPAGIKPGRDYPRAPPGQRSDWSTTKIVFHFRESPPDGRIRFLIGVRNQSEPPSAKLHLTATGVQAPTINAIVTVLPFFFKVTLDRPEITRHLVFVYEPRKLPRVSSHPHPG